MKNFWMIWALGLLLSGGAMVASAQEGAPAAGATAEQLLLQEIMDLRVSIESQRREIQALREEVAQLRAIAEGRPYRKPTAPPPQEPAADDEEPGLKPNKPAEENPAEAGKIYKVKSGDTLSSIARHLKVTLGALEKANPGVDPKSLRPGMELKIP